MRAVRLTETGLVFDREYPQPVPAINESLVRVTIAGICSTDLELVKGYYGFHGVLLVRGVAQWPLHCDCYRVVKLT